MPSPGDIIHVDDYWEEPAGGGPGAAVQLAKLAGSRAWFFTALGDDELGHRAAGELTRMGLDVHAAWRDEPQRRAVTFIDEDGERAITIIGRRLHPNGSEA